MLTGVVFDGAHHVALLAGLAAGLADDNNNQAVVCVPS